MAMSLLISWLLAVTVTPLFCVWFLKLKDNHGKDPYDKPMYRGYRSLLRKAIKARVLTVVSTVALLFVSIFSFRFVDQAFFADSTTPYFYVNYWKAAGTHIDSTASDLEKISEYLSSKEGVKNVSSFAGEGTLRFIISYSYETPDPAYGMLLVEVDDYRKISSLIKEN